MISPKVVIINHFDKLSNKVEIDFDQSIQKYNEKQTLGEILIWTKEDKNKYWTKNESNIFRLDKIKRSGRYETIQWSKSTTVIAYLRQVRDQTLGLLEKEQESSVGHIRIFPRFRKINLKAQTKTSRRVNCSPTNFTSKFISHNRIRDFRLSISLHSKLIFTCLHIISVYYSNNNFNMNKMILTIK